MSNPLVRSIVAVLVGCIVCGILIALVQTTGMLIYPVNEKIDWNDRELVERIVSNLPLGALLFVLASYAIGTFCGSWLAAKLARRRPLLHALSVAGVFLVLSVWNLASLPFHPTWFAVVNLALFVPVAWLAASLVPVPPPDIQPVPEVVGSRR